jgi:hypothetical protein
MLPSMADRPSRWIAVVLSAGLLLVLILLAKLAYDLSRFDRLFIVPVWAVFLFTFAVAGANVFDSLRRAPPIAVGRKARGGLLLAVPAAFVAASADCMGLEFRGCTSVCDTLVRIGIPVMAAVALGGFLSRSPLWIALLAVLPLGFLVPNCNCYNPINGPWIDWLGKSPACFAAAATVTVVATAALHTGRRTRASLLAAWILVGLMVAFAVLHHTVRFPW